MQTSHTILLDLLAGQSTTDAIAQRMTLPQPAVQGFLQDLETDGLVTRHPIVGGFLTAWRITPAGRQITDTITAATA